MHGRVVGDEANLCGGEAEEWARGEGGEGRERCVSERERMMKKEKMGEGGHEMARSTKKKTRRRESNKK